MACQWKGVKSEKEDLQRRRGIAHLNTVIKIVRYVISYLGTKT